VSRLGSSDFRAASAIGDVVVGAAALGLAFWVRTRVSLPGTETLLPAEKVQFTLLNVLLVAAAQLVSLSLFGLYASRERSRDPLGRLLIPALFFQLFALSTFYFLVSAQGSAFPRSVLVLYVLVNGVFLAIWRRLLDRLLPLRRRKAVVVGSGPAVALIVDAIRKHPWTGVDVVGVVTDEEAPAVNAPRLGGVADLERIAAEVDADEVIVTPEEPTWRDRIGEMIPREDAPNVLVWPSPFETMIGRLRFRIV